ncbi:MAG: hypothetical protein CL878_06795 [Dehalococcoidia bacterium]|nr:hypothetical protein [Dehalococcoidia bacterium]
MAFTICGTVCDTATGSGVGGVSVSNGETVVQTDSEGRYSLPVEPECHRFVTATVPDRHRPQVSFFHPTRSWRHSRDDVDFPLVPAPERASRAFSVGHISDSHVVVEAEDRRRAEAIEAEGPPPGEDPQEMLRRKVYALSPLHEYPSEAMLAEDLRRVEAEAAPELIVATGDLTNVGTLSQLRSYRAAIESVTTPVFSVFGGHDGNEERVEGRAASTFTQHYEAVLGPTYYSFDWGGRHVVVYATEERFFSPADQQRKERWLWADLAAQPAGQEIILVLHVGPTTAFLNRLRDYRVCVVLHGHAHTSKVWTHGQTVVLGTPTLCFGGIDTRPRGFRHVRFAEDGVRAHLIALPQEEPLPAAAAPAEIDLGGGASPLQRRWQWQVPGGIHRASPVQRGSQLLVSQQDEAYPGESGLTCLELATGNIRWQVRTDAAVKNRVAVAPLTEHPQRNDEEDRCVAVSVTGQISALSLSGGEMLWQVAVPGYPDQAICTRPVVLDGAVYVAATGSCAAYDLVTGKQLWHTPLEHGTGRSYAEPQLYDDLLIVLIPTQGFLALRRDDGRLAWQRHYPVKYYCAGPVVFGDHLVCVGEDGDLVALEARSGRIIWERPGLLESYAAGLAVDAEQIYVTTAAGEAQSYELHSGEQRWRFEVGEALLAMACYRRRGRSLLAPPVPWRDHVVIGGLDGWLYLLDEASGECISRTSFGSPISAAPYPTGDGLCIGTYDGRLLSYVK